MRLLTFTECARRLDPDGGNIVTESWLRGQLRAVKVGKRHLVPEPVFIEFCEELLRQCRNRVQGGTFTHPWWVRHVYRNQK